MLRELEDYYARNGILSTSFTCEFKNDCKGDCEKFTGPKSAFVSSGYADNEFPRLLFLSLDSGSGDPISANRLPAAVRKHEEWEGDFSLLNRGKHWYRTHELAWYILRKFNPRLNIGEARRFFAHANSAKCCMNKKQRKKADKKLFQNCKAYLKDELKILDPEILVTQGDEAKDAIQAIHDGITKSIGRFASIIALNGKQVFWLHTYHPGAYAAFNEQRNFDKTMDVAVGWELYASRIHDFVVYKST